MMIDMILSHTVEVAAFFHLTMMRIVVHHIVANVTEGCHLSSKTFECRGI